MFRKRRNPMLSLMWNLAYTCLPVHILKMYTWVLHLEKRPQKGKVLKNQILMRSHAEYVAYKFSSKRHYSPVVSAPTFAGYTGTTVH